MRGEREIGHDNFPDQEERALPTVQWWAVEEDNPYATVRLPHGQITGTLTQFADRRPSAYIDIITVEEQFQGQGIGTRLLRAFTAEMKAYDATSIEGRVVNGASLKTLARVFGKDNLLFHNHITGKKLELTYEQVLLTNPDLNVRVDITELDTSDWELPERIT